MFTANSRLKLAGGWPHAIQKIGRFWPLRWRSAAQSGKKTRIFSDVVWPRGHQTASSCFCRSDHARRRASPGEALRSKIAWNAKTTNLVLRKLVGLAALWNLNEPRG